MNSINIESLKVQFKGKPFNQLIKYHLKRQKDKRILREAVNDTIAMLPESAFEIAIGFIDIWNDRGYDKSLWSKDTSEVFLAIVEDARSLLSSAGIPIDDETLFNMFQIVVLSYAYSASDQRKMRKFIGI